MTERGRERLDRMDPETRSKVEAIMARNRTPEARAGRIAAREAIESEVRETGGIQSETGLHHPVRIVRNVPEAAEVVGRLRMAREAKGMSLDDLARASGMERSAIARLERGETNPTIRTLGRYADGLGMRLIVELVDEPASPA